METEDAAYKAIDGSGDVSGLFNYISYVRVNGNPILPPLMTAVKRHEMRIWRQMAVEVENRKRTSRRESVSSDGISAVETKSTPARPITLNLQQSQGTKICGSLEHRLALDQSDSDTESERKRCSPLQVSSLQDYRLQGTADSDSTLETPDTVTASPRLNRQASYTILKPSQSLHGLPSPKHDSSRLVKPVTLTHSNTSPALNSSGDVTSSQNNSGRTNSGRRTWDLRSAQKNWETSRGLESDTESESCPVTPSKSCQSGRSLPRPNSVPSTERVPFEDPSLAVPSSVRDQLSTLSDMMIALTLRHEKQRRELQRQQEQERDKYEHLFTHKQRRILEFISSSSSLCGEPLSCPSSTVGDKTAAVSFRSEPPPAPPVLTPAISKTQDLNKKVVKQNGRLPAEKLSLMDTDVDISLAEDPIPLKDDDCETWSLSSRASTISSEPVPIVQRNGVKKNTYTDLPLCNKAAGIICAGAKGYLTRRLMETEPVKSLRRSLRDSIQLCKSLKTATDLGSSDIKFMDGLRRQIFSDWDALYEIFMTKSTPEQMAMISADRERLRAQKKVAPDSGRRVSAATIKSLQRKKNVMSTSLTFPRSPSFRRSCFKMSNSVSGALPTCNSSPGKKVRSWACW